MSDVRLFLPLPLAFVAEYDVICMEYPFDQLGSAVPAVSPPNFLCTPSLLTGRVVQEAKRPWCRASTVQRWVKHHCVVNTVFTTNPKHSTLQMTMKKIHSVQAQTSTDHFFCFFGSTSPTSHIQFAVLKNKCAQTQDNTYSYSMTAHWMG